VPDGEVVVRYVCVHRRPPQNVFHSGCPFQSRGARTASLRVGLLALCGVRSRLPRHLEDGLDHGLGPIVLNEIPLPCTTCSRPLGESVAV
jgi:hypothetical protein